jgi:hypothetical protein
MGFEKFIKELEQAQKALSRLDGTLANVSFDPNEPASIHAAILQMEAKVDNAVSLYRRNPLVKNITDQIKESYANQINEKASEARNEASQFEEKNMNNSAFRKIENIISDLKWADQNTFDRHIKKLSAILKSDDLVGISEELVQLVDLSKWLEVGHSTQGGMVGSAELDWPTNIEKELGLVIALAHWFADDPRRALDFGHTFYYSGSKITPELQGMVAQVFVPFGRDFINYARNKMGLDEPISLPLQGNSTARKVFVVHGHDESAKEGMARFLEKIGFEAVILHEQASGNRTIIEKIEANSDVGFAVVLLSPDDFGAEKGSSPNPRARQNVILELGYFVGRLGRARVAVLKRGDLEVPSDFGGVVYVEFDQAGAWKQTLGKELQEAGFSIDWNKVILR